LIENIFTFKETYIWKKLPRTEETPGVWCKYAGMQGHQGKIYFAGKFSEKNMILKSFDIRKSYFNMDGSDF